MSIEVPRSTPRPPENTSGQVNSRGLHEFYGSGGGEVRCQNVHVSIPNYGSAIDVDHGKNAQPATWVLTDSEVVGGRLDNSTTEYNNTGTTPSTNAPSGVPMSPQEALNGTSSAAGLPGESGGKTPPEDVITADTETMTVRME
jgi:hypothetical protein